MALVAANARVAITGVVSIGDGTQTAPTDSGTALGTGWTDLGYVSEDGVTETRDRSTNTIRAWQNGDTLREVVTESTLTYAMTFAETKAATVELFYGNTVDDTDGSIVIVPSSTGGRHPFVIDVVDGDETIRTYIPDGEVTEVGDQTYVNGELIGYEVTITCYPSSTIQDADGNPGAAVKFYSGLVVTP